MWGREKDVLYVDRRTCLVAATFDGQTAIRLRGGGMSLVVCDPEVAERIMDRFGGTPERKARAR